MSQSKTGQAEPQGYTFSQIKIQILEIIDATDGLKDASRALAAHLVLARCRGSMGLAVVKDSEIAEFRNCSTDTVSRAVQQLARSGLFEIQRGRWNKATEYRVSDRLWLEAVQRRQRPRNVADLPFKHTRQNCGATTAELRTKTPQFSQPLKNKEEKDALVETTFIPKDARFAISQWSEFFSRSGLGAFENALPTEIRLQAPGYLLPGRWPVFKNGPERDYQEHWLRLAVNNHQSKKEA